MPVAYLIVLAFVLLSGVTLLALETGRALRLRSPEKVNEGIGPLENAVYGLMGLLVGFTFASASGRFDHRLDLFTRETSAIDTVYRRVSLVPANERPPLREDLRDFLNARVAAFRVLPDLSAAKQELELADAASSKAWNDAVTATQHSSNSDRGMVLQSINDMIDAAAARTITFMTHPNVVVYILLVAAITASGVLAGYSMGAKQTRSWIHVLGFAFITSASVCVILEIDFPRTGVIQTEAERRVITSLETKLNP